MTKCLKKYQGGPLELKVGLPRLLAKQVANIFRNSDTPQVTVTSRKAERMTLRQLLEAYDVKEPTDVVGERLQKLSSGKRFLVFMSDGSLNITSSEVLLKELRQGYEERGSCGVFDGMPCKIYCVGEHPGLAFEENPLFPGELLRPDGTCDHTHFAWSATKQVRIMLHLALRTKELTLPNLDAAHNAVALAHEENAAAKICQRYPKACVLYGELAEQNSLPTLRIQHSKPSSKQDPFFSPHKRY